MIYIILISRGTFVLDFSCFRSVTDLYICKDENDFLSFNSVIVSDNDSTVLFLLDNVAVHMMPKITDESVDKNSQQDLVVRK